MLHVSRVLTLPNPPHAPNRSVNNLTPLEMDQITAILRDYSSILTSMIADHSAAYYISIGLVNLLEKRREQAADLCERIESRPDDLEGVA